MKHCQIVDFIFLISIIYLFIYLVAPGFNCSMRNLLCVMWNHSLGPMDSLVVAYGLSTCGAPA